MYDLYAFVTMRHTKSLRNIVKEKQLYSPLKLVKAILKIHTKYPFDKLKKIIKQYFSLEVMRNLFRWT